MRRDRNPTTFEELNEQKKKEEVDALKQSLKAVESSEAKILAELKKLEAVESKLLKEQQQLKLAMEATK